MINAIENNYNNTAKRLANIGGFETTISRMVNQDVATLGNSITTRQELFDFLDGVVENKFKMGFGPEQASEYARYNSDGLASAKYLKSPERLSVIKELKIHSTEYCIHLKYSSVR